MSKQAVRRSGAVILAVSTLVALAPRAAFAAPPSGGGVSVPVTGSFTLGGVTQALPANAVFTVQKFANQNGQLVAIGALTDPASGGALPLTLPVQQPANQASCSVLDLTLGPLHLDLLGLVIDLNQVNLQLTAQQGSGNLLGNLLCAVAGLLNGAGGGGGGTTAVANLLNQVLAAR